MKTSESPLQISEAPARVKRPALVVFAVLWLAATAVLVYLAATSDSQGPQMIPQLLFIIGLIWYLNRTRPTAAELPDLQPLGRLRVRFGVMTGLIILVVGLVYASGVIQHPWLITVAFLSLVALGILIAWRRRIKKPLVVTTVIFTLLVFLSEVLRSLPANPFADNLFSLVFNVITVPLFVLAGGLLLEHTRLTQIRLEHSVPAQALKSFLLGCLLALPPALANLQPGTVVSDPWVDQWWKPLVALVPGIAEESWARLFLVTLCYALLRPTTNDRPNRAIVAAVLIGALTHAAAHVQTLEIFTPNGIMMLLFGGLLYGLPMGMLLVKRDFEHAVGYHFFIDFVRFLVSLLRA